MSTNSTSVAAPTAKAAITPSRERQSKQSTIGPVGKNAAQPPGESVPKQKDLPEEQTAKFWIAKISCTFGDSAGWMVLAGKELSAAKAKLIHGQWSKLFEPGGLKISPRTAQVLMRIGDHPYFSKTKNFADMPPSYMALYALSTLDEPAIEQGVLVGAIKPDMTITAAIAFVRAHLGNPQKTNTHVAFNPKKRLGIVGRYLDKEKAKWPDEQLDRLADHLKEQASSIRSGIRAEFSAKP